MAPAARVPSTLEGLSDSCEFKIATQKWLWVVPVDRGQQPKVGNLAPSATGKNLPFRSDVGETQ